MSYLYMYDVRGIQDYVFRTNKIKEIIGASLIVDDLVLTTFKKEVEEKGKDIIYDISSKDSLKFDVDHPQPDIDGEILYYGGGNLLVLFKDEKVADEVSHAMCVELTKQTYSLQLAVAKVKVHGENSYLDDYKQLQENMEQEKAKMPTALPVAGFPITLNDPVTGFPFSKMVDGNKATYESYLKMEKYKNDKKVRKGIQINDFKSADGDSLIAIVHIDGNNMGSHIRKQMENVHTYKEAAKAARTISEEINHVFIDQCLAEVENQVPQLCDAVGLKDKKFGESFRRIISAGDDITFVCNARIALGCVKTFMDKLGSQYHACAGIFVCHSHFPFSRGYQYAEQLCDNAKKCNREYMGEDINKDTNFIDFQTNFSGIVNDVDYVREHLYVTHNGKKIYGRPYHVGKALGEHYSELNELMEVLQQLKALPRTKLKGLREAFYIGEEKVDRELLEMNSRLSEKVAFKNKQILFDAIDIMDLRWGEVNETNSKG